MELKDLLQNRKSIRKYKPDVIAPEKLMKIGEAFRLAPSAKNLQNWRLFCVQNPEIKQSIQNATPGKNPMFLGAPAILVAVGLSQDVMTCGHRVDTVDISIAMSYVGLMLEELGLSGCLVASFYEDQIRRVLNLPPNTSIPLIMPIGYADELPPQKPRKPLQEIFTIIE